MEQLKPGLGTAPHPPFRVLRLIMTAGAAAAGLCLILAMTTLATSFGKADIGDTGNYTSGGSGSHQHGDLNRQARPAHSSGHHGQRARGQGSGKGPGGGHSRSRSPRPRRSQGQPTPSPTPTPSPSASQPGSGQPGGSQSGGPQPGATVEAYQGSASTTEGPFHIGQPGDWGVLWSFQCPDGRSEDFSVSETAGQSAKPVPGGLQMDTSGPSGSGLTWQSDDVGDHFLVVTSGCSWTVSVVLPKSS